MSKTKFTPKERRLLEAVADIGFLAGACRYHSGDSRQDVADFIQWAQIFESKRKMVKDGFGEKRETYLGTEYLTAIEAFTMQRLEKNSETQLKRHADCPVCAANVHGRVTVALNYLNSGKIANVRKTAAATPSSRGTSAPTARTPATSNRCAASWPWIAAPKRF
jgi:hypothetical protein